VIKKIFYIKVVLGIAAMLFLFQACKKDSAIAPIATAQPVVVAPTPPFVIKDSIYPRVCKGIFTIKTNTTDSQQVQLFNRWGRVLINLTINGTTAIVDTSLTNGVYIIEITNSVGKIHTYIDVVK